MHRYSRLLVIPLVLGIMASLTQAFIYQAGADEPLTSPLTSPVTPTPTNTATPTPTVATTPTGTANNSNNDNHASSGGGSANSSSPAVCNDAKPQGKPVILSLKRIGLNQVKLTWTKVANPVSYYLIAYSTKPGVIEHATPELTIATPTYTIGALPAGKTFYFKVRAGNGCMPGEFSSETSVKTSGLYVLGATPAKKTPYLKQNLLIATPTPEQATQNNIKTETKPIVNHSDNIVAQFVSLLGNIFH